MARVYPDYNRLPYTNTLEDEALEAFKQLIIDAREKYPKIGPNEHSILTLDPEFQRRFFAVITLVENGQKGNTGPFAKTWGSIQGMKIAIFDKPSANEDK